MINFSSLAFISLSLFLSFGCSRYIQYIEKQQRPEITLLEAKDKSPWCEKSPPVNVIHDDPLTIKEFPQYIKNQNKSIADLGLLFTLYQMLARPDSTDWYSRVQIHVKQGDRHFSRDYSSQHTYPLYSAFRDLKQKKYLTQPISRTIAEANRLFPRKIKVQKELSLYLSRHKDGLKKIPSIKNKFFRLEKPLQYNETYFRDNIELPKDRKAKDTPHHLFSLGENFSCNFDSGLYQKGIFLLSDNPQRENVFGLIKSNGDYILILTKKRPENLKRKKYQILPGATSTALNPYCLMRKENQNVVLMGLKSRDSGQLLYHLFNYGVSESENAEDVYEYIKYPRHQFLLKPARLLYESKRGSDKKLRYFLNLDFPVYHADELGLIIGAWSDKKETTFLPDPRTNMNQSCQKK